MKRIAILLILCCLSSCSWHLAREDFSPTLQSVCLQSAHPYARFETELRHHLQYRHVTLNDNATEAKAILHINSTHLDHETPTLGTSSQARIYTFIFQMTFELRDKNHRLLPLQTITTRRHLILPKGQLISNNNQLRILERDLHLDAIRQLFDRLRLVS